jgi:hypothetical protein
MLVQSLSKFEGKITLISLYNLFQAIEFYLYFHNKNIINHVEKTEKTNRIDNREKKKKKLSIHEEVNNISNILPSLETLIAFTDSMMHSFCISIAQLQQIENEDNTLIQRCLNLIEEISKKHESFLRISSSIQFLSKDILFPIKFANNSSIIKEEIFI